MIRILIRTDVESSDRKGSILHALKYHDKLCDAFMRQGWRPTHPLSEKLDAGSPELTFESRMKRVVMKTFIYPCDKDFLWNIMKYPKGRPCVCGLANLFFLGLLQGRAYANRGRSDMA